MNTIIENNKIIAEFMQPSFNGFGTYDFDGELLELKDLKFHVDWNWLMPVIDKLKEVWEDPEELDNLKDALWWENIRGVYEMVFDLIKEHNENTRSC